MEQGLTGLDRSFGLVTGSLICLILISSCEPNDKDTNSMPPTNEVSPVSAGHARESARLAKQMRTITALALPDEWYSAKGNTLAERFDAAAQAMRAKDPKAPSGAQLMARFENAGKPFVHAVWVNRPLFCSRCKQAGGDGFFTVMSVARGLSVRITAGEFHAVTAHDDAFPLDKLSALKQILESR